MRNSGVSVFFLVFVTDLFEALRLPTHTRHEGGECSFQKLYYQSPNSYAYMLWLDCQLDILPLSDYDKMNAMAKEKAKNVSLATKRCVASDFYIDMKFDERGPVMYFWNAFKKASESLRIQHGMSTYKISWSSRFVYKYYAHYHATDGFLNIMTDGYNQHNAKQHFLWYNASSSFCASIQPDVQNEWLRMGLFNRKQSSQLALWNAAKGTLDENRFSPIASVITGLALLIVCLILFIPLPCLINAMFKSKRKFRRLRRRIEVFLTTCFARKIVDQKFIAEDYKLLMQKLKANRPQISIAGKRVPSRKTTVLPVDDITNKKPDIPATAFGGSVMFPIPTATQLFTKTKKKPPKKEKSKHKTITDVDLKSKDEPQPAQAKESVLPLSSTAQSDTTTTVDNFAIAYSKDDANSNIMRESGIQKISQPFELANEVSAIDYDSGTSKPQTPHSTTASKAALEAQKPTTSVEKAKEQKAEKDVKKESKDTKKSDKYPFDLSETQKE
ncbi:hypothetical protein M3Y96_01148100 [Aphelenchoides besseyi]|nr:hypothetical protein M3Y96_01148100 [Aphelenchoides besseyi]